MVYDNPYCSGKPNEAASKEYADVIAADIERNKCVNRDRFVCDQGSLRHTKFTTDKCDEAQYTYAYAWHSC